MKNNTVRQSVNGFLAHRVIFDHKYLFLQLFGVRHSASFRVIPRHFVRQEWAADWSLDEVSRGLGARWLEKNNRPYRPRVGSRRRA